MGPWLGALLFIAFVMRSRRKGSIALVLLLIGLVTSRAAAQAVVPKEADPPQESPFALHAALSGSIDEPGAALAVGARYRLSPRWLFGLDAEWNPWASFESGGLRAGTFNTYASAVFRAPMSDTLALRVTGHLGISTLLFDMYGAPRGSTGPYLGLSLLGLEVRLSRALVLVLDPADVAVAIPHVTGIPYVRRQYRATIGIELSL